VRKKSKSLIRGAEKSVTWKRNLEHGGRNNGAKLTITRRAGHQLLPHRLGIKPKPDSNGGIPGEPVAV
jgi:hypothetical protein